MRRRKRVNVHLSSVKRIKLYAKNNLRKMTYLNV